MMQGGGQGGQGQPPNGWSAGQQAALQRQQQQHAITKSYLVIAPHCPCFMPEVRELRANGHLPTSNLPSAPSPRLCFFFFFFFYD